MLLGFLTGMIFMQNMYTFPEWAKYLAYVPNRTVSTTVCAILALLIVHWNPKKRGE